MGSCDLLKDVKPTMLPVGFITLLRRELYRIVSLPNQTVFPPLVTAVLYLTIFGYAVGSHIPSINGVPYRDFIFPGIVMMTAVSAAYTNPTQSLFIARNEKFVQDILVSPLSYFEMALAYTLGGAIRGSLLGVLTLLIGVVGFGIPVSSWITTMFFLILSSLAFAAFGNVIGIWADRFDHIAISQNYILSPMVFLGGVFYSSWMLPPFWRALSYANPIFYTVAGFRSGIIGASEIGIIYSATVVSTLFTVLFIVSLMLFRCGYKLRT